MAFSASDHRIVVPAALAPRIEAIVSAGEFASFHDAAVAMLRLGLTQHDQTRAQVTAAGRSPPALQRGPTLSPSGPAGGPATGETPGGPP